MKRNRALGVALVTGLSGSLLIGCTLDGSDTTASTPPRATAPASAATPLAYPLGGTTAVNLELEQSYWITESPQAAGFVALDLLNRGKWTARSWGNLEGQGTYELNGDTITWLGGIACADGEKGAYTYTVQDNRLTQTVQRDPCQVRRESFDGVVFRWVSPPHDKWLTLDGMGRPALAGIETGHWVCAADEEPFRMLHCIPGYGHLDEATAVVVFGGRAYAFDDPDLDKVSEVLGNPFIPLKEFCDEG